LESDHEIQIAFNQLLPSTENNVERSKSFRQGSWCFACCHIANKCSGKGRL